MYPAPERKHEQKELSQKSVIYSDMAGFVKLDLDLSWKTVAMFKMMKNKTGGNHSRDHFKHSLETVAKRSQKDTDLENEMTAVPELCLHFHAE